MSNFLIACLGNIGSEYNNTRHNIGFEVADFLAKQLSSNFSLERHAHLAEARYKGKNLYIIKPTTYMNLSGKALKYWLQQYKIPLENTLTVLDDKELPLGKIRIRPAGSDGGHNGLKNIAEILQTTQYPRLRMGIGNDFARGKQIDFVLGKWSEDEKAIVNQAVEVATEAVLSFVGIGIQLTMTKYNK